MILETSTGFNRRPYSTSNCIWCPTHSFPGCVFGLGQQSAMISTTLEKSHRTVGEKNAFTNSFREKNHIRTKFSIWWVPPQYRSHPAFPWPCFHSDFIDCSEKRIVFFFRMLGKWIINKFHYNLFTTKDGKSRMVAHEKWFQKLSKPPIFLKNWLNFHPVMTL